jgi:hypothetical protein
MKKLIALGICLVALSTTAFAQINVGVGGIVAQNWMKAESNYYNWDLDIFSGGFFVFVDTTYVEVDLGLLFGSIDNRVATFDHTSLTVGLIGKYPVVLGDLTVFPLVGFDYNYFLSGEIFGVEIDRSDVSSVSTGGYSPGDAYEDSYDAFSIVVGAGVDLALSDALFIRGELRWGFKLNTQLEKNYLDTTDGTVFSHGPKVSLAVGYSF